MNVKLSRVGRAMNDLGINTFFQNNHTFVDDEFPPSKKSLYYNSVQESTSASNGEGGRSSSQHQVTQWLRPSEIADSATRVPWAVFRTPLPSDISQVGYNIS